MKDALIIMIKNPEEGKVKTRLAKTLGNARALEIYRAMLRHTQQITAEIPADRFLFYSDMIERSDIFPDKLYKKYVQCTGDLGMRMDYAFSLPFKDAYKKAVMIGADCVALQAHHITAALAKLDTSDFVIGPSHDGGYYLIGMKQWNRWIFRDKPWSTAALMAETEKDIRARNAGLALLDTLHDIDTEEDLAHFHGWMETISMQKNNAK